MNFNVPKNMKRTQNRHATAKTSHFSVFDAFNYIKFNCEVITARFIVYLIKFIDVRRVTPPADEIVSGQLSRNLATLYNNSVQCNNDFV